MNRVHAAADVNVELMLQWGAGEVEGEGMQVNGPILIPYLSLPQLADEVLSLLALQCGGCPAHHHHIYQHFESSQAGHVCGRDTLGYQQVRETNNLGLSDR